MCKPVKEAQGLVHVHPLHGLQGVAILPDDPRGPFVVDGHDRDRRVFEVHVPVVVLPAAGIDDPVFVHGHPGVVELKGRREFLPAHGWLPASSDSTISLNRCIS